jgi:hypothetical protein
MLEYIKIIFILLLSNLISKINTTMWIIVIAYYDVKCDLKNVNLINFQSSAKCYGNLLFNKNFHNKSLT